MTYGLMVSGKHVLKDLTFKEVSELIRSAVNCTSCQSNDTMVRVGDIVDGCPDTSVEWTRDSSN